MVGCPRGAAVGGPGARWITNPDLLVLDEATSAVDPALEVQLRRAIERLTAGRTSITVAHRLSTAEAADGDWSSMRGVSSSEATTPNCSKGPAFTPASTPTGRQAPPASPETGIADAR